MFDELGAGRNNCSSLVDQTANRALLEHLAQWLGEAQLEKLAASLALGGPWIAPSDIEFAFPNIYGEIVLRETHRYHYFSPLRDRALGELAALDGLSSAETRMLGEFTRLKEAAYIFDPARMQCCRFERSDGGCRLIISSTNASASYKLPELGELHSTTLLEDMIRRGYEKIAIVSMPATFSQMQSGMLLEMWSRFPRLEVKFINSLDKRLPTDAELGGDWICVHFNRAPEIRTAAKS